MNADDTSVINATPNSFVDKNLFSYCDNNPVMREDNGGAFWDIALDIISIVLSAIEVVCNPADVGAWIGLALDVVDVVIPTGGGLGEAYDVYRLYDKGKDALRHGGDIIKHGDDLLDGGKTVVLHRPYIRKPVREEVERRAARNSEGLFLDANLHDPIYGKHDLGHVYGHEFWRERDMAMRKGWSQKQFNDYMNNPDFYQIENPSYNRSHRFEKK